LSTLIKRFGRFLPVSNVATTNYWQERSALTLLPKTTRMACRLRHYVDLGCVALWAIIRGNTEI
jgi:hypothetical protein